MTDETEIGGHRWQFVTTAWGLVAQAGDPAAPGRGEALNALVAQYWKPVYHFVRHSGHSIEDAKDLTQGFFEHFLRRDLPAKADPARGRFRWFLLASVRNFLRDARDRASAAKRAGDLVRVPLDPAALGAGDPEAMFNREWAAMVIDQARKRFAADLRREGREEDLRLFERYLDGLAGGRVSYEELSAEFGIPAGPLGQHLFRARARFREIVLQVVRQYAATPEDAQQELEELFGSL